MEKKLYMYEALIYPSNVGFEVYVPDLDVYTQGEDLYDAAFMGQDLIQTWVSCLLEEGREVPEPTFGRKAPEGGYVMGIATDAPVPEVPEMSVEDAAGILGVSKARVYAMVKDGVLDGRKVGASVLVSTASVKDRFNNPRAAGRPAASPAAAMA